MNKTALAIFVKTPGLTPAKTRLAKVIGTELAEDFYLGCLKVSNELALALKTIHIEPYWAVAEKEGLSHKLWSEHLVLDQGEGNLAARLHHVYTKLKLHYDNVLLIGADSPHLQVSHLTPVLTALQKQAYAIGQATDGGFYVFGGSKSLGPEVWNAVKYSEASTCDELVSALGGETKVSRLETQPDVDVESDLVQLYAALKSARLDAQVALRGWMRQWLGEWL